MKYILSQNYALRSYRDNIYKLVEYNRYGTWGLSQSVFEWLLLCDGKTECPTDSKYDDITKRFIRKGIIREAEPKDVLSSWQQDIYHDNNYIADINLQITGKCNFNCRHCFNAKDNERLQSELSLSQIMDILDQAKECGVVGFTITGGEPMVHKDIFRIFDEIYKRNLFVFDFNTNGVLLTRDFLAHLRSLGADPLMKISFDGLGFHDWMRGRNGAEEKTLKSIKLCKDNGFRVKIQMQINRKNADCIQDTFVAMENMGVDEVRIIRTTEASRWIENAGDACLTFEEYYDKCYELLCDYMSDEHSMKLTFWQFAEYDSTMGQLIISPDRCNSKKQFSEHICPAIRTMLAISATGKYYPCMQVSGTFENAGITYGSIFETPLRDILGESELFATINLKIKERREHNKECMSCKYFDVCKGGCPALGYITSKGDFLGVDRSKCLFFNRGYYDKLKVIKESAVAHKN